MQPGEFVTPLSYTTDFLCRGSFYRARSQNFSHSGLPVDTGLNSMAISGVGYTFDRVLSRDRLWVETVCE